jgi:hypothetical protein
MQQLVELVEIRTIALIVALCRVAGQKVALGGGSSGKRAAPSLKGEAQKDSMHARVWQLYIRPGKVQNFKDSLSSVVDLARQQGDTGVFSLWPLGNQNHRT